MAGLIPQDFIDDLIARAEIGCRDGARRVSDCLDDTIRAALAGVSPRWGQTE